MMFIERQTVGPLVIEDLEEVGVVGVEMSVFHVMNIQYSVFSINSWVVNGGVRLAVGAWQA